VRHGSQRHIVRLELEHRLLQLVFPPHQPHRPQHSPAAVVDSFEYLYQDESGLQPAILSDFLRVWHALDPMGTGELHYSKMPYIVHNVVPPLGVGEKCPSFLATKFLASLPVPIDPVGHTIKFRATLMAMLRVRLHLWQYAFPDVEALRDIMAFVAPGTDPMRIAAAFPDPGSNELSLRFLYTVIQMQRLVGCGIRQCSAATRQHRRPRREQRPHRNNHPHVTRRQLPRHQVPWYFH